MSALTKQQKAAKTRAANATKGRPYWTRADRIKLISQDKVDLLDHPATNKYYIGGKDGGKSRSAAVEMITSLETDPHAQGLALKKYKYGGIARLHTSYQNIALEIKALGFSIPEYEKGVSETYRMVKAFKSQNQQIEYSSFDDANGLAGIEAKNLGYFSIVHIEEPVLIDDDGKLPTMAEWRAKMSTIKKSVARSNRKYISTHAGKPIEATKYIYTMNPWDDHPIIEEAEQIYPEHKFITWVMEDYLSNHTRAVHHKETDSLWIRTTTLSNPVIRTIETLLKHYEVKFLDDWNNLDKSEMNWELPALKEFGISEAVVKAHLQGYDGVAIWFQIERAIMEEDSLMLASLLGLKYQGSSGNQKTWMLDGLTLGDSDTILRNRNIEITGMTLGWDIDIRKNRGLVATPIYYVKQLNDLDMVIGEGAVIGKQRYVPIFTGDAELMKQSYWDRAVRVNKEIRIYSETLNINPRFPKIIYVDENKLDLIIEMRKFDMDFYGGVRKPIKQGHYDIETRQRLIQSALTRGFLFMDKENTDLYRTMKASYIKEGDKKRDEKGKNEKEYDYINSFEYAFYPLRHVPGHPNYTQINWEQLKGENDESIPKTTDVSEIEYV